MDVQSTRRRLVVAALLLVGACKPDRPRHAPDPAPVESTVPDVDLLLCRGGAPASVTSHFDVSGPARAEVDGNSSDYLAGLITADMTVVRQVGAAGMNGATLDPGSCAFPGRSMYDSEPSVLRLYRHDTPVVLTWTTRDGTTTAPVPRTFVDDFVADPATIVRLKIEPEPDTPGMSRIITWDRVPPPE